MLFKKYRSFIILFLLILIAILVVYFLKKSNIILNEPIIPYDFKPTKNSRTNKRSITWIIHNYPPIHNAGGEYMLHSINKFLINQGYTINVIVPKFPVNKFEGVNIYTFQDKKEVLKVINNSYYIGSHFHFSLIAVKTASIAKKPIIIVIHDDIQKPYLNTFNNIYPNNIHLIYNSVWIKNIYNYMGINSCVVFPPVDWKEYKIKTSRKYVTLINCNSNKGGSLLIKIAKKMPDIEFLGIEGAYNHQIKDLSVKNIKYLPSTPNIKSIYEQTDIVLMPSKNETWGRVAVEAISSGIPVIANPTPGLREALDYCGIFISRDEIDEYVKMIRKLKTDEAYYKKLSTLSIKRSRELDPESQLKLMDQWISKIEYVESK